MTPQRANPIAGTLRIQWSTEMLVQTHPHTLGCASVISWALINPIKLTIKISHYHKEGRALHEGG